MYPGTWLRLTWPCFIIAVLYLQLQFNAFLKQILAHVNNQGRLEAEGGATGIFALGPQLMGGPV
jgi:hypothetical protein